MGVISAFELLKPIRHTIDSGTNKYFAVPAFAASRS
jgi:hypothetical protein